MSNERRQVLEMLSEGKITAEEAERLLEKLEAASPTQDPPGGTATFASSAGAEGRGAADPPASGPLKYLRVVVESADGDHVNVRVPLALVRTGLRLSTMLPQDAQERLDQKGIDLSQLNGLEGEELIESLRDLNVDVDSAGGDVVRVFCE